MINDTVMEMAKYQFTPDELIGLADRLQRELRRQMELEKQKKSVAGDFNEQKMLCTALMEKIADGFEIREVECRVLLNDPRNGVKRHIRNDNDEIVREVAMTEAERQESLPFDEDGKKTRAKR